MLKSARHGPLSIYSWLVDGRVRRSESPWMRIRAYVYTCVALIPHHRFCVISEAADSRQLPLLKCRFRWSAGVGTVKALVSRPVSSAVTRSDLLGPDNQLTSQQKG